MTENNKQSTVKLKKPVAIFVLAFLFILAPIGNIIISFIGSGIDNWYQPIIFASLLRSVNLIDWIWLTLLVITGILLLKPHKLPWTVAIVTLMFVLGMNAYRLYQMDTNSIEPHFLKVFSVLAIMTTLGVLMISFYFRFPYLDQRTKWLSADHNPDRRIEKRDGESDRRKKS
ncbi:MAG: hypothetical protein ACK4VO_07770 [Pseudobdellovibrio sp.]